MKSLVLTAAMALSLAAIGPQATAAVHGVPVHGAPIHGIIIHRCHYGRVWRPCRHHPIGIVVHPHPGTGGVHGLIIGRRPIGVPAQHPVAGPNHGGFVNGVQPEHQ